MMFRYPCRRCDRRASDFVARDDRARFGHLCRWCHAAVPEDPNLYAHHYELPSDDDDVVRRRVIAIRLVPGRGACQHVSALLLADGAEISAADAGAILRTGGELFMIPPPGAPAVEMYLETGAPLLLSWDACPVCRREVVRG